MTTANYLSDTVDEVYNPASYDRLDSETQQEAVSERKGDAH